MINGGMHRRHFIGTVTLSVATVIGHSSILDWLHGDCADDEATRLTAHEEQTLGALFDAVVPGPFEPSFPEEVEDPEGAPGAIEGKVVRFWEKILPQSLGWLNVGFLKLWVKDLDLYAFVFHRGRKFKDLRLSERQDKIQLMMWIIPGYHLKYWTALMLVKAAFYADLADESRQFIGRNYIGFPGPNSGFDDYSYEISPYY
ncbi:MAG: hypothetical protein HYR55_12400 [Acidobacteria bacterium]|nr:hypothetical protein [Acidobacteriota bacterium]MBI3656275.1 hypothetical protein [Acidobacteriota bacterium]